MKVTVNFGRTGVVVPCKDSWMVRDLIDQATQRYRKLVEQDGEFVVRTHHVEYADGGILDPDDMLTDLLEDKDKLIAVFEEMELQGGDAISPGGSVASGYSSPYTSEPELGVLRPAVGTEIEVTSRTLKSNTPLMVRSSSELVLPRSPDFLTGWTENSSSRPAPGVVGQGLTVKAVSMDFPKQDLLQTSRSSRDSSSSNGGLTRTVQLSGDIGPLGIKVVPYCSSLSGRTLGLHIKGIEEESRTKKEGIFQEDECIVQINNKTLKDKTFNQSQEVFRQAMSSTLVWLEVLPVSNRTQYERSLISQIFSSSSDLHGSASRPRSPFLLPKTDPAPFSQTPPPREEQPQRPSPVRAEWGGETPPPAVRASPTPRSGSGSPASMNSSALMALANAAHRKGGRKQIDLNKGPDGLGFTVVTRDSSVHGPGPILVKSILPRGAAIRDGRLQSGDRILEVNGVDVTGFRQEELVAMLRSTKLGQTISLLLSRQDDLFLPRELKGEPSAPFLSEDGGERLMFEIPLNDSGSAGLGVSLKGNKSRETGEDLGVFIKSIIHGGAAFKDGRLRVNDQLLAVNGEPLAGRSNHDAMETLRRSMSTEGNMRGTIQLMIERAPESSAIQTARHVHWKPSLVGEQKADLQEVAPLQDAGQTRGASPFRANPPDGTAHPPMVTNSIYQQTPAGSSPAAHGRAGPYEEDYRGGYPSAPSHLGTVESDPSQSYPQTRGQRDAVSASTGPTPPQYRHANRGPDYYIKRASKSMDLVADESNLGSTQSQRPAPPSSSLGPTLGLQKSSSLESLQTAVEEAGRSEVPFHRPAGPVVRGRGCNMSFRQAMDKSYEGPSEPEDDYSESSSGRDTPASSSSRHELEDPAKEKKKKPKKKKEKKIKAKKKEEADDPEKKSKKKGFALLRFGKKNKEAKAKAKLGSLSEEELERSEAEVFSRGRSPPNPLRLARVEDDDFDPNYARINHFRDPPPPGNGPYPDHMTQNSTGPKEDPLEGLYAKVNKTKPLPQTAASSNDARLQHIRSQLQHLKPLPSYGESGPAVRLQEYDPSRIRGPDPRMAPKYDQNASVPRRTLAEGYQESARSLNPSQPFSAHQQLSDLPRSGPYRYDLPPSPLPGQQRAPSYESATRGRVAVPDQYGSYGDGQYPKQSHKNPAIGAV